MLIFQLFDLGPLNRDISSAFETSKGSGALGIFPSLPNAAKKAGCQPKRTAAILDPQPNPDCLLAPTKRTIV